jgi:hypothetical protein
LESHARYFDRVPPVDAATLSDAGRAVAYLEEISPQMRGCAIFSESLDLLAASGKSDNEERWLDVGRELIGAADAAGSEPVAQAHVATGDGEAFCVRESGLIAVAVTERFVLASLMMFDMRNALRKLAASGFEVP